MPNSRRRKFSVKNNLKTRPVLQSQNAIQVNFSHVDSKSVPQVFKSNLINQSLENTTTTQNQNEFETSNAVAAVKRTVITADKDVTVSLSTEDSCNDYDNAKSILINRDKKFSTSKEDTIKIAESSKQRTETHRERHSRQHRIKIRNPRHRIVLPDKYKKSMLERSVGTTTQNSKSTFKTTNIESVTDTYLNTDRESDNSIGDMCRICHGGDTFCQELGDLISACSCRGTVGRVHVKCLERWLTESGKSRCELCGIRYITRRVHRYGVPRSLIMWILSQNAKQLMVDTLGIILMSPLAVLAAWLSGKTFSTLISQENHAAPAPWPLASTFVLACMTLVCYYCWIVSAATRHTLSWWIWYRSQYEVRLQLHNNGDD